MTTELVIDYTPTKSKTPHDIDVLKPYGVLIHASEGASGFNELAPGAGSHFTDRGTPFGIIHTGTFGGRKDDAVAEAKHAVESSTIVGVKVKSPLALWYGSDGGTASDNTEAVIAFMDYVKNNSELVPIVYLNKSATLSKVDDDKISTKYPKSLWIGTEHASMNDKPNTKYRPDNSGLGLWRFSSDYNDKGFGASSMTTNYWTGEQDKAVDPATLPLWIFKDKKVVTQSPTPYADYSHIGKYAYDIAGDVGSRDPYYAPCDMVVINDGSDASLGATNMQTFTSVKRVQFAKDGEQHYLTISCMHDNNPKHKKGDIIKQGEELGHMGDAGASGVHLHLEIEIGRWKKDTWYRIPGKEQLNRWTGHINDSDYPDFLRANGDSISIGWKRPGNTWTYDGDTLPAGACYACDVFFAGKEFPDGVVFKSIADNPDEGPSDKEYKLKTEAQAVQGLSDENDDDTPDDSIATYTTVIDWKPAWY